jgi:hypothetical protein
VRALAAEQQQESGDAASRLAITTLSGRRCWSGRAICICTRLRHDGGVNCAQTLATCVLAALLLPLSGCSSLALTAASVGGSAAINHSISGSPYRTFTAPRSSVKTASLGALKRMGIKVTGTGKGESGTEFVTASAQERDIEINLEALSASSTRMQVVARSGGLFYDGATANEIIFQTERLLNAKLSAK